MKRITIALVLAFGFTGTAFAQDIATLFVQITSTVVGTVAGNIVVGGMDGVSCGATAAINEKIRRASSGGYRHDADYDSCVAMQQSQRLQAYYQRMAMEQQQAALEMARRQQAEYEARQNAPTCRYYEQNGQTYRTCGETVVGNWRR
ncbi:MAG: hypothetical protein Q8Q10_04645 [bacterium]|nr:hypothetical protein [bacterium]